MTDKYASSQNQLTTTDLENFKAFVMFIADNNLWDEVERHLKEEGITTIAVSSAPIAAVRSFIVDRLLKNSSLDRHNEVRAQIISRCTCGSGSPGAAGHGPVSPSGGGNAGTDGGPPPR